MLSAHTDFGSLSFLHNRLGGLQVLAPGTDKWQYVKPLPGHAICNIGDSLNIFSGGILRSNMHRVVPPPKEQAKHERYSLVFFTRASDSVELHALADESAAIASAVAKTPNGEARFNPGVTAKQWLARRVRNQRLKHFTGLQSWQGTEDQVSIARATALAGEASPSRWMYDSQSRGGLQTAHLAISREKPVGDLFESRFSLRRLGIDDWVSFSESSVVYHSALQSSTNFCPHVFEPRAADQVLFGSFGTASQALSSQDLGGTYYTFLVISLFIGGQKQ
ncbi:uncharacterized protein FIBRA_03859 [Fibroporia radiculosa]|uniref:Fe2OG dioxygenase domain-containing protein n=1 Tax=Fibroporia radiculosa TaxID=599839 RepID=J4HW79_9APHY|nr:uncharacterized protein FIBRA_03859 [Fibroporia radiculosa]CCM01792.1 predicted protein [Fibroporia radiculosa]